MFPHPPWVMNRPLRHSEVPHLAKFGVAPIILVFSMVRLPLADLDIVVFLRLPHRRLPVDFHGCPRSRSYSSMVTSGRFCALIHAFFAGDDSEPVGRGTRFAPRFAHAVGDVHV